MGATPAAASADAPTAAAPAVSSPAVPAGAASAGTPDAIATVASASAPTAAAAPPLLFTDTHCHIHDRATYDFALRRHLSDSKKFRRQNAVAQTAEFERRRAFYEPAQLATRAAAAGVHRLICIGTDPADSLAAANFAAASATSVASATSASLTTSAPVTPATAPAPAEIFWAYGIHPDEATPANHDHVADRTPARDHAPADYVARDHAADIQALPAASRARLVAIGEVGLDYHESSDPATRAAQIHLFESMLDLATCLNLPLIFHIRAAFDDFFAVLVNFSAPIRGVVHSFSDSPTNLARCLDHDFYIGVNGLATFADIPLPPFERILLETDAPFLAPVPHRGAVNEPAFIPDIAANLAPRLQTSLANLAITTEQNATQLFHLQ